MQIKDGKYVYKLRHFAFSNFEKLCHHSLRSKFHQALTFVKYVININ